METEASTPEFCLDVEAGAHCANSSSIIANIEDGAGLTSKSYGS